MLSRMPPRAIERDHLTTLKLAEAQRVRRIHAILRGGTLRSGDQRPIGALERPVDRYVGLPLPGVGLRAVTTQPTTAALVVSGAGCERRTENPLQKRLAGRDGARVAGLRRRASRPRRRGGGSEPFLHEAANLKRFGRPRADERCASSAPSYGSSAPKANAACPTRAGA